MVIEETRDLAETADCVVIEAILVDDGLRYRQLSVGIKGASQPDTVPTQTNNRRARAHTWRLWTIQHVGGKG